MRSAPSRVLSIVLATVFCLGLVPHAATGAGVSPPPVSVDADDVSALSFGADAVRAQGTDRLGTSIAISQAGWETSEWVVLATSQNYPDALVAGPLAAVLDCPVLLTPTSGLASEVASEVVRLGAQHAILVGGESALSGAVQADLTDLAGVPAENVERLAGRTRYDTSRAVALRMEELVGDVQSIVLATGEDFPDALSVSGLAGAHQVPIVLTRSRSLSSQAQRTIDDLGAISTLVVGGEAAISAEVATLTPYPRRIGGADRYDTARLLAEYSFVKGFTYETIIVAVGTDYPDALCAGPLAASRRAPVVLTRGDVISKATDEFFNAHCTSIKDILVTGGVGAIGDGVVASIEAAAMTELSPDLEPLSASDVSSIETIAPDGSSLVIPAGSPMAASLETSSVLVSGPSGIAPAGMLLRVLSVSESGGKVTVETTQAALDEVILKGSLDVTGTIDPNDGGTTATDIMVSSATPVDENHIDVTFDEAERDSGSPTQLIENPPPPAVLGGVDPQASMGGSVQIPFQAEIGPGGEDKAVNAGIETALSVEGSITFSGDFSANASWGYLYWQSEWWGGYPVYGLQFIELRAYMVEVLETRLAYEQSASLTIDVIEMISQRLNKDVSVHVGTSVQWVGAVPVITEFELTPIVEIYGSVGGKVGMTFLQSSYFTAGLRYDWNVGWRPIRGCGNAFAIYPSIGATAGFGVEVGAQLECLLYGVAGPYFGVTGNLGVGADTTLPNWWWADLTIAGRFGGKVDILGRSTTLWEGRLVFWAKRIATAAGPFPNNGIIWLSTAPYTSPIYGEAADARLASLIEEPQVHAFSTLSSAIDESTLDASDFTVPGLDVTAATLRPDGKTVRLTTSKQTRGTDYLVLLGHESFRTVDGAWATNSGSPFVGYWPITQDYAYDVDAASVDVVFDAYDDLDPASVAAEDFSIATVADPGVHATVTSAAVQPDGRTVRLTLADQLPGVRYNVDVMDGAVSDGTFTSVASSQRFTGYADYTVTRIANVNGGNSVSAMEGIGQTAYMVGMSGYGMKTTNGGLAWSATGRILPTAAMNGAVGNSYCLAFPGDDVSRPVASTYAGVISRSTNSGTSWSYFDNDAVTTEHAIQLDFNSATHGVGVKGGQLLETDDAGATWVRHPQDGTFSGSHLRFANALVGYIAGASGKVYRTDDGGETWAQTSATGVTDTLLYVCVSPEDPDLVVAGGANGVLVRSEDGGASWQIPDSGTTYQFDEVEFADGSVLFGTGVGGFVIMSRDAGRTWQVLQASGAANMGGLHPFNALEALTAGVGGVAYTITGN